jgi:hypothetical protein
MLIVSAVAAGVVGLALVALGWWVQGWEYRADWGRLTDPAWWTGSLVRGFGYLMLSKAGLKVMVAVVVAAMAVAGWWRHRSVDPADSPGGAQQALGGETRNP